MYRCVKLLSSIGQMELNFDLRVFLSQVGCSVLQVPYSSAWQQSSCTWAP